MLLDLLSDVATLIEDTVTVDKVAVTPGQPAATDKCSAVYVWGDQIFDSPVSVQARGDEAGCVYRRAYSIAYRLDVCIDHHSDGTELTTTEFLTVSTSLYDKADAIWCALTHAAVDGTLFTPAQACESVVVGALVFSPPQGDRVSATGSLRVTHPCEAEGS